MHRTVKDAEVRRLELLETSLEMFGERGYERVSVQDIVDRVGVAKGTFYHYFASKEELLSQIAEWQAVSLIEGAIGQASQSSEPVDELRDLLASLVWRPMQARGDHLVAYLRTMYRPENLALRVRLTADYLRLARPRIAELLSQASAVGAISITDADATSDVIVAMWRGMNDHIAEVLAAEDPQRGVAEAISHLKAMQDALERILGVAEGSIALFDYAELDDALRNAVR